MVAENMDEPCRDKCQECGKKLDLKSNEYHRKYGMCDSDCYARLVGLL